MHPLKAILTYHTAQPTEVKELLAFQILKRLGDGYANYDNAEMKAFLEPKDPIKDLGKILGIRALVDFIFLTKANESCWQEYQDFNLDLVDSGNISVKMRTQIQTTLSRFEERKNEWMDAYERWEDLCDGKLGDSNLMEWTGRSLDDGLMRDLTED